MIIGRDGDEESSGKFAGESLHDAACYGCHEVNAMDIAHLQAANGNKIY